MVSSKLLSRSAAKINFTYWAAFYFLIIELLVYALPAKCVEALGDGGGVAEEAAAERARHAAREPVPLDPDEAPRPPPPRGFHRVESEWLGRGNRRDKDKGHICLFVGLFLFPKVFLSQMHITELQTRVNGALVFE